MNWSLAKAKDNFSEVVRRSTIDGPQDISIHGERTAVVVSANDYDRLTGPFASMGLKDLLRSMNFDGADLSRDQTVAREIDL